MFNPLKKLKEFWRLIKRIDEISNINAQLEAYGTRLEAYGTRLEAYSTRLEAYDTRLEIQNWHRVVAQKIRARASKGSRIRVAFYVVYKAVFPAHNVFKLMLKDELFDPKIIVIPDISRGEKNMEETLKITYSYYNMLSSGCTILPRAGSEWVDASDDFDLICSANPYDQLTHHFYGLNHIKYKPILPFYVPYAYNTTKYLIEAHPYWNLELLWIYFMDNCYTASYARKSDMEDSMHCYGASKIR